MNLKLVLGIFFPLAIIILSVFLIEKEPYEPYPTLESNIETINSISSDSLFVNKVDVSYDRFIIQTIVTNAPISNLKEVSLPISRICLFDKEGVKAMRDLDFEYVIVQETVIKLLLVPVPKSAFDSDLQSYTNYDEVLLLGPEKACAVLEIGNLENVTHIAITK